MKKSPLHKLADEVSHDVEASQAFQDVALHVQELLVSLRHDDLQRRREVLKNLERLCMNVPVPAPKSPANTGPGAGATAAHTFSCPKCGGVLTVN